jgi:hypothetical protein
MDSLADGTPVCVQLVKGSAVTGARAGSKGHSTVYDHTEQAALVTVRSPLLRSLLLRSPLLRSLLLRSLLMRSLLMRSLLLRSLLLRSLLLRSLLLRSLLLRSLLLRSLLLCRSLRAVSLRVLWALAGCRRSQRRAFQPVRGEQQALA